MTQPTPIEVSKWRIPVECYSRIVGYLMPLENWNEGKRQEWKERKAFVMPKADITLKEQDEHKPA
jgi:hypothetical protein